MMRTHRQASLRVCAIASLFAGGCHQSSAAETAPESPPSEEVWLSAEQVAAAHIQVSEVEEREVDSPITTSGRVALDELRVGHVFSPVTGRVLKIDGKLGARVRAGEGLAVIESPDIGSAVADTNKAQADLAFAEGDRKRKKDLLAHQAASASDVEASEDNYRRARAEADRARQKETLLHVGGVDVVTQTYTLPAPIAGEILVRNINQGVEVQGQYSGGATQELFTIGDLDAVVIYGDLYEMDLARVSVGTPAEISLVAYPGRTFPGAVDWVASALDPATRAARVRITLNNPNHELRPEMYATVELAAAKHRALALPRSALLRLGNDDVVLVRLGEPGADGVSKYGRRQVEVVEGGRDGVLEVVSGLRNGESVVTDGALLLSQKLQGATP